MKTATAILLALPAAFYALMMGFAEQDTLAISFFVIWVCSVLACIGWAHFLRREHRKLARACVLVGCLHLALGFILAPLLNPAKSKRHAVAEPARSSQQPQFLRFSLIQPESLLAGFVGAWPPAAVADRGCWATTSVFHDI